MTKEITRHHVKMWVVKTASVTNPYRREMWYASVTIGYDYSEQGKTLEAAYNNLVDYIFGSPSIMSQLKDFDSFKEILKAN